MVGRMPEGDPFDLCGVIVDGKYRVLSVVGQGGFGVVYKGVHEGFDAPVAIKCLKLPPHFDYAAQEALVRQLREEGRLLLRLSQRTPGILQALDVGWFVTPTGARVPYLVLEWLEGRTLGEEMRIRRGMPLREAFARLDPAARALAVAHEEKIAHRDIKPDNLFCITPGGKRTIKILDFGIAKLLGDAASPTSDTAVEAPSMFTPRYAAPEQFDKKRGASGPWTDVFAFALVLVELTTGQTALQGDGIFALYAAASDPGARPTLRARGAAVPEAVERVIAKALHPEPAQRYPDLGSFWRALEAAIADTTASLPPMSSQVRVAHAGEPGQGLSDADLETAKTVAAPATGRGLAATTPSGPIPPTRMPRAAWMAFAIVAFVAGGAGAMAVGRRGLLRILRPSLAPSASASTVTAAVVAPPVSSNPAAAALYHEAMQAWHDGLQDRAIRDMERAAELDRELGAAQIRLALWYLLNGSAGGKLVEAREHYQEAVLHRSALGDRDLGLVNAAEPYLRQPWDLDEWGRRMEELTAKLPSDVELLFYLGASHLARLQPDPAIATFERALQMDPGLVAARVAQADALSMKGDPEGQLRAYKACLEMSPEAAQCLVKQLTLRARIGDCAAMRTDAQRLQTIDPKSPAAQRQLAMALYATGSSGDSVLEALGRSWALEQGGDRRIVELQDRAALAAVAGDFASAQKRIEEWQAALADKLDQPAHAAPAQRLADVLTEVGLPRKASDVADAFLRRMNAWTEPAAGSSTMLFLSYKLRAGTVSKGEYEKSRAEEIERFRARWQSSGRKLDDDFAWAAWWMAYGAGVGTEDEAKVALLAMPKQRSKAVDSGRWPAIDLAMGRTYALAGAFAEAVAPLRRAGSPCLSLADPVAKTWAQLYLGAALEGTGDKDGARAAYRIIVDRWGKAIPRSFTADKARRRLALLGDRKM
jgi:serine/threonine-protein kinase